MALMNKPHRVQPKYECTVPASGTSPSRTYKYDVIQRGGPGHALVIGNDYCPACPHCRKMLRVYGANNESAKVRSEILRAVGWMQVTKSIWLCDECKDDPYAVQTVSDASFLREARPSLAQMYGMGPPGYPPPGYPPPGYPQPGYAPPPPGYPQVQPGYGPPPQMPQQQPPPQMPAAAPPPPPQQPPQARPQQPPQRPPSQAPQGRTWILSGSIRCSRTGRRIWRCGRGLNYTMTSRSRGGET